MPYYCLFNGTGGFSSPTLGNLLSGSPKLKIVVKKFNLAGTSTTLSSVFWVGGISVSNREFVLRRNNGNLELFVGGTVNTLCTVAAAAAAYGTASMTCDEWAVELDGTTARMYKDGAVVITNASITRGTSRLDLAMFRIGCQPADDAAGNLGSTTFAPNGTQYGGTQVYINDVLVRNYVMPSTGTTVPDSVGAKDLAQVGTWPTNDSEWVFYSSGASNTATISGGLPKIIGSVALNEINPVNNASVNGQLPKLAGAVSLLQKQSVSVAGQLPKLTGSANLRLKQSASVSGQLPKLSGSIALQSASNNKQIAVTAALPKITSNIQLSQELTAAVAGQMPKLTADIQLKLAGVYPQAESGAYAVSYRVADDTVITASISESTAISAIISQQTTIRYAVQ